MTDSPNRPSAPAPRSSLSEWRTSEIVKAYRHRIAMQMGNEFLADYHDDLDLLCDAVASCGERGGGLDPATIEACAKVCDEMREPRADGRRLVAHADAVAATLAERIRALSSSPPSAGA